MKNRERLNFMGTATLVGMLSLSPQAGFANENQSQNIDYETFSPEIFEQDDYGIFLKAVSRFIRLDKTTGLREIFNDIEKDPEKHIEIKGSNYSAYLIDEKTGERKPNWSIQFAFDETKKRASIGVVIDNNLDYFRGDDANLEYTYEVPYEKLMLISNHAFNVPDEMKYMGWDLIGKENDLFYFEKKYVDRDGNIYSQKIREDFVIIFEAPYPLPLDSMYRYKERPLYNEIGERKI